METYISIVHSLSGRHTGVLIMSDDQMFIRESAKLVGAIREVYGGERVERIINSENNRLGSEKSNLSPAPTDRVVEAKVG